MKKLLFAFLGAFLAVFLVIATTTWALPTPKNFISVSAAGDNSFWAIENRGFDGCLYRIENNRITAVYRRSFFGSQGDEKLLLVSNGSEKPYVIETQKKTGERYVLTPANGGFKTLCKLSTGENDTLLDLRTEDGGTYLTGLTPAGGAEVYTSADPAAGGWTLLLAEDAPEAGTITNARYENGALYLRYSTGDILRITSSTRETSTTSTLFETVSFTGLRVGFAARMQCKSFYFLFALLCLLVLFLPPIVALLAQSRAKHATTAFFWAALAIYVCFAFVICAAALAFSPRESWYALLPALCAALAVTATGAVISASIFYLHGTGRPLRSLAGQMSAVAEGQKLQLQPLERRDEIGDLSRALQELTVSLSIRDYELSSTVQSYHRFVPRGIETLLERASIAEVSLGDSRVINGNVGILSICNRMSERAVLSDDDYVTFVNRSSTLLEETICAHGGILLSAGYDMAGNRVYFPGCEDGGVSAALDLLGAAASGGEKERSPHFCVLLHKTSFLYGIAGSSENLFPYLSSAELEFLSGFADQLYNAGSRVVVTGSCYEQARKSHALRYIGFVVSDDGQTSLKLYEALDALTDLERNRRISYDERFQEAIGLFYKSDFYLARNIFSDILRVCPADGIAHWYLFACEQYFQSGGADAAFQLFGTEEH